MRRTARHVLLFAALGVAAGARPALAVADEIQVYDDACNERGKLTVDNHLNDVLSGTEEPAYEGELPPHHVFQWTPEFALGLGHGFEAGLYIPFAVAPGGHVYENGLRVRVKYISLAAPDGGFFWGLNGEFGVFARRVAESEWNLELRPIAGYRSGRWFFDVNPILGVALSGAGSRRPEFEPCAKMAYQLGTDWQAGVEHYASFGQVGDWLPPAEQDQQTYLALDYDPGAGWALNLGIGHGWTNASEDWVVKAIVGFELN